MELSCSRVQTTRATRARTSMRQRAPVTKRLPGRNLSLFLIAVSADIFLPDSSTGYALVSGKCVVHTTTTSKAA